MKLLRFSLVVLFAFWVGSMAAVVAQDWERGENRIPNPDFEKDAAGAAPIGWVLEDGT